jgi:hypothetical protein
LALIQEDWRAEEVSSQQISFEGVLFAVWILGTLVEEFRAIQNQNLQKEIEVDSSKTSLQTLDVQAS